MIDTSRFAPIYPDSGPELAAIAEEAERYITRHSWCGGVTSSYLAADYGAIVLLLEIVPLAKNVDPQVWVMTGDVPLSHMDTGSCTTPVEALAEYCVLSMGWIREKLAKRSTDECIELTHHGTLDLLATGRDAVAYIPNLIKTCERLIADEAEYRLLHPSTQEELVNVCLRCTEILEILRRRT